MNIFEFISKDAIIILGNNMCKNKILILAYPGSGKTYLAENYKNVADLEFQHFRWDYGEYKNLSLEQLKGKKDIRTEKPNWLENFYEYIMKTFDKYPIISVPMSTSIIKILDKISSSGGG